MLKRPIRLHYDLTRKWGEIVENSYFKKPLTPFLLLFVTGMSIPHIAIRTHKWLDKLPVWEERIQKRIIKKTAFDYMIKS